MDYDEMTAYLDRVEQELHAAQFDCPGNLLLREEMENGLRWCATVQSSTIR